MYAKTGKGIGRIRWVAENGKRGIIRADREESGHGRGGNAAGGPGRRMPSCRRRERMSSEVVNEIVGLQRVQTVMLVMLLILVAWKCWEDYWGW